MRMNANSNRDGKMATPGCFAVDLAVRSATLRGMDDESPKPLSEQLLRSAVYARRVLDEKSLERIARFILSCQNPDGGFRGRGGESDLLHTLFAVAGLRVVDYPVPLFRLWKHLLSFGTGKGLGPACLACLFRLRQAYPMLGVTRRRFRRRLAPLRDDSPEGRFLWMLASDELPGGGASVEVAPSAPTTTLAAAILANGRADACQVDALLDRVAETGGFVPTASASRPDLRSTAAALAALVSTKTPLDAIQKPCLKFTESLWRGGGGFAGHAKDTGEDVENTFYALLSIGCLVRSMTEGYAKK